MCAFFPPLLFSFFGYILTVDVIALLFASGFALSQWLCREVEQRVRVWFIVWNACDPAGGGRSLQKAAGPLKADGEPRSPDLVNDW